MAGPRFHLSSIAASIAASVGMARQPPAIAFLRVRATARVLAQVTAIDDDAAFVRRRLDDGLDAAAVLREPATSPHGEAAAEQRHGMRFLDQARGLPERSSPSMRTSERIVGRR
jgi:hypothetical protein